MSNTNEYQLPNDYRNFIHKSRYAKWAEDKGSRESWHDTVARYVNHIVTPVFGDSVMADPTTDKDVSDLGDAILSTGVMPSMRSVMTAGKAAERDNTCMYNCFSGDTKFMTSSGVVSFSALNEGAVVEVLTQAGDYRNATVRSYGVQELNEVTLRHSGKSGKKTVIKVTGDHTWFTLNKGKTTDLSVGDRLPSGSFAGRSDFNPEAWLAGFGFGDGTIDSQGSARVRLCGEKAQYLDMFESYGHNSVCYPPSSKGDPTVIFHKGHFGGWKQLPLEMVTDLAWLTCWFEGYMAADGSPSSRQPTLSSQDGCAIDFFEEHGPSCGFIVTGKTTSSTTETNFGKRKNPLQRITVRPNTVFYVESINSVGEEEVFCVEEPTTSSFTLACGVLTGNCAYMPVDSLLSFDEAMFILLCGTGVGFSVERQSISKLPAVPETFVKRTDAIKVADSKEGWAKALRKLIKGLYNGEISSWDVSGVRPAGAKLKTFGGRSSGPAPLVDLFNFVTQIIVNAAGRKLTSLECHDIFCKIGEVVVVGGVRRSAMISLSNLSDDRMRHAKSGQWWENNPQRALANNSVSYTEKPDAVSFMREWVALAESGSGERGVFNRQASIKQAQKNGRRKSGYEFGTNPCSEIILRPYQFCNLSEVVVRAEDTFDDLKRKVRLATILGTIQSTYTHFPYLRKIWADNTEEERLLGVSLTGIMDHKFLSGKAVRGYQESVPNYDVPYSVSVDEYQFFGDIKGIDGYDLDFVLHLLKQVAIDTNKEWAEKLGIPQSTSITCVKPSGTVSQLVDSASGIHARHNDYYIRTVRGDIKDPITQFMIDQGIPNEPCVMKPETTVVFSFPQKSPEGAVTRKDMTAIEQLELWLTYQRHWCEHKPSITVSVKDNEWLEVGAFVYKHFDEMSGVSFLPMSDHTYQQAPYQDCSKEEYEAMEELMPKDIDWALLSSYEFEDNTVGTQTFACVGSCEIVDLT